MVNRALFWSGAIKVRDYVARWWRFTRPLILLQFYLPVVAYLGLYLIQKWYGSEEQGYYALALQWSAFAMVFTNSGVWIFWREIAHHSGAQDLHHAARIYEQFSSPILVSGAGAGILAVGQQRHTGASGRRRSLSRRRSVLAIMAFYPVSQTMNQLAMAALKAMERTGSYARWTLLL